MSGYTKDFLVNAFLWRYTDILLMKDSKEEVDAYVKMVTDFFDRVGKDKFREWCSLDAAEIKKFRLATGQ